MSSFPTTVAPLRYSELQAAFEDDGVDQLQCLIDRYGAQALVDTHDDTYDDVILRHICDTHTFSSENVVVKAKLLLDSLPSDSARYNAVLDLGYENVSPLFCALTNKNEVLTGLFLDSVPHTMMHKLFSLIETIYTDDDVLHLSLISFVRYECNIEMWKLCVKSSERVEDPTHLLKVYRMLLRACISQNAINLYTVRRASHARSLSIRSHSMVDMLFASIERIYKRDASVVDALFAETNFSCEQPQKAPMKWQVSGTYLHYAVRCNAYIVEAMLRICECRYAEALLTTVDDEGMIPKESYIRQDIVDVLDGYVISKPATCRT